MPGTGTQRMSRSMISSEVDFEADRKQSGYLHVPHSVHRFAYGWVPVPITVIRNGSGPTLVLAGGNHGDENEGQIVILQLARDIKPEHIQGRLVLLPMLNFPAVQAGTRELHARGSVYAYHAGVFEPFKSIGDDVTKGEFVVAIHHPDTPLKAPSDVASPDAAFVLCQRAMAQAQRGDAVYQFAADAGAPPGDKGVADA